MPNSSLDHLGFFVEVLLKLDELNIPYVIIGGFAATMFGITRTTYDIDIVVDMGKGHIQALSSAFPSPPYYADPYYGWYGYRPGPRYYYYRFGW